MDSRIREALEDALECMIERRGYCEIWEYKYGERWNREDSALRAILSSPAEEAQDARPMPGLTDDERWTDPEDGAVYYSMTAGEYAGVYKNMKIMLERSRNRNKKLNKLIDDAASAFRGIIFSYDNRSNPSYEMKEEAEEALDRIEAAIKEARGE